MGRHDGLRPWRVPLAGCAARSLGVRPGVRAQSVSHRTLVPRINCIIVVQSSGLQVGPVFVVSLLPHMANVFFWWAGRVLRCGSGILILEGLWARSVRKEF